MKVFRGKVNSMNRDDFNKKRTKASMFINFLVKVWFIPVAVTKEKIVFKILHWKTIVNSLFIIGFMCSVYLALYLFDIPNNFTKSHTNLEKISHYIVLILSNFVRIFPLILSYGLQNLRSCRFNTGFHENPNKIIFPSFLLFSVGLFLGMIDIDQLLILSPLKLVGFGVMYLSICFMEFFTIFALPLMIEILTKDFNQKCQNVSNKEDFKDVVEWYHELNNSLQFYCLCFYSYNQFMFIFNIYKSFSSLMIVMELKLLLSVLGKIAMNISMVLNIMTLTTALDSTYQSVQSVKMKIQENLMLTYEKSERQQMKFLLENVKSLSPMNACGYFEISKESFH